MKHLITGGCGFLRSNIASKLLKRGDIIEGRAFNAGRGIENSSSFIELFRFLERELDFTMEFTRLPSGESNQRLFVADIRNVSDMIGWQPKISKEKGVRKMLNWMSIVD